MTNKTNNKKSAIGIKKSKTNGKCCGGACGTRKRLVAPAPVKLGFWQRLLAFLKLN